MFKIFIFKRFTIYGLAPSSISQSNIASLNHKLWNDFMEFVSFIVQSLAFSFLSCTQAHKIIRCYRCVLVELKFNSPQLGPINFDIHEDVWVFFPDCLLFGCFFSFLSTFLFGNPNFFCFSVHLPFKFPQAIS